MTSIFISYSRRDKAVASQIADALRGQGASVFIDYQEITGGEDFLERLRREIEVATHVVLLISTASAESQWVRPEITHAFKIKKPIIPLVLEQEGTRAFWFLGNFNEIDLSQPNNPTLFQEAIEALRKAIALSNIEIPSAGHSRHIRQLIVPKRVDKVEAIGKISTNGGYVNSIAFSPNGQLIAAAFHDGSVRLFDLETLKETNSILRVRSEALVVKFSPDGQFLASAYNDPPIRLSRVADLREVGKFLGNYYDNLALDFSPDGELFLSTSGEIISLWDMKTRNVIVELKGHQRIVRSAAFSPDGTFLASGSMDGTIRIWNVWTREEVGQFNLGDNSIVDIAFSPSGRYLASTSRAVQLWDLRTMRLIADLSTQFQYSLSIDFSPNGQLLLGTDFDGNIDYWDVTSKSVIRYRGVVDHSIRCSRIKFSPDGTTFATSTTDGTIILWGISE